METALFPYVIKVLVTVLALLIGILAWIGREVIKRLDLLTQAVADTNKTLGEIDKDLRADLHRLSVRMTRVESVCKSTHGVDLGGGFHDAAREEY